VNIKVLEDTESTINKASQRKSLIDYPSYHNKADAIYSTFVEGASPKKLVLDSNLSRISGSVRLSGAFKSKDLSKL
jgi:hypothetical protein